MINKNSVVAEKVCITHQVHRICWSAIFGGALVGVGLGFLLHLYGIAISLSAFSSSAHGASVVAIGGVLGLLLGVIASMGVAGFVSGFLGRFHYYPLHGGAIYGFVTWSLILFLSVIMMGPMDRFISAYGNSLSHSAIVSGPSNNASANVTNLIQVKNNIETSNVAVQVSPKELALGGWIVFILFFVGALSSCIGATCGLKCKREYTETSSCAL
jgi:hypothetical protein